MIASNQQDIKTHQWLLQNVKSSIQITRQAKLVNSIAGERKLEGLRYIKNMDGFMKVLIGKNCKANNKDKKAIGLNGCQQRDNDRQTTDLQMQVYTFRDHLLVNERLYNKQVKPNYSISDIEMSQNQINYKIKKALSKCRFVHKTPISKMPYPTGKNVSGKFQVLKESVESKYSDLGSIYDENNERFIKLQKQKKRQQRLHSNQAISQKLIDDGIRDYLIKLVDNSAMCDLLTNNIIRIKQLHQRQVFIIFIRQLLKRILSQEDLNPDIFSTSFSNMTNRYFTKYVGNGEKHVMYARIRQQRIYKSVNNDISNPNGQQEFWIRCLMLFFSQQHSHQQLIELLEKNNQSAIITALQSFYHQKPIPNKSSLQSTHLFSHNIAYRILVKILINQSLSQSEYDILYPKEKDILVMIKLRFVDQFYRTMEFKEFQESKIDALKDTVVIQNNKEKTTDILRRMISLLAFDQIFFNYFLTNRQSITNYHLLLLLQILLSHPKLLNHSIYPIKSWVFQLLQVLKSVIKSNKFENSDKQIVMVIKIMQISIKFLNESDFEEQLQSVLLVRKDLLRNIMNHKFNFIEIVQKQFNLKFVSIERVIIKSLQTNKDQEYFMNTCLSSYLKDLNFHNKSQTVQSQSEETCDSLSNLATQDCCWLRQLKYQQNWALFKTLNREFLLGLKLANRYLTTLLNQNGSQHQEQDKIGYCLRVFQKTKQFLSKFHNIFILRPQKNESHWQESTNGEQTVWFESQIEQSNNFLYDACSLLEIGEFLISFMTLQEHFDNGNMEGVWRQTNFIQHLESKYENLAVAVRAICQNIQKFSIADKTFGQSLLYQYSQILMKSIENVGAKKSRRIKSQANELNGPMLMEFIDRFSKIVKQNQQ